MKKIPTILFAILCWGAGLYLLYETLVSYKSGDPWGLAFAFITLPLGLFSLLILRFAIILTKDIIYIKKIDRGD